MRARISVVHRRIRIVRSLFEYLTIRSAQ